MNNAGSRNLRDGCISLLVAVGLMGCVSSGADEPGTPVMVKTSPKTGQPWKECPTRTLDQLAGFKPAEKKIACSQFGGRLDRKTEATGFFQVRKIGDRWWLMDPEGCPFIHVGVCAVAPGKSSSAAFKEKFASAEQWSKSASTMLRESGFNGTGAWSDWVHLRQAPEPLVYTVILDLMGGFGSKLHLTHQQAGHKGYPNDCIPVFHPGFESFCEERARLLEPAKDDPWRLGYFSDNELPAPRLEKFLALDSKDPNLEPNYRAAQDWLAKRKGLEANPKQLTDDDRSAWSEFVWSRYFEITTRAIRRYDPHHLCLGSRFHGSDRTNTGAWRAAGKYLDAVAFNYYSSWGVDSQTLKTWSQWSGKPVMITEFYTKGMDSGMANTTGAGWTVSTQRDRGLFYQHFVLGLLESKTCVGWHWFKYMDNDPEDLNTDPSNRDSNKGIVTIKYEGYSPLLESMKSLNRELYPVIDYFDAK